MDATNVEDIIRHQIVMINLWEDPRKKKKIMPSKDIEEIVMVKIMEIGAIVSHTIVRKTETQTSKNHQAAIQDLETKFGRIFDHQSSRPTGTLPTNTKTNLKPSTSNDKPYRPSPAQNNYVNVIFTRSGKTYEPPVNPNAKPTIFLDDSDDEADEVTKEAEPLPKKPSHDKPPPLKAYLPKISYP
nr:reverse transcriptase domain-containing protein [Tanacetum cinerariifolium]